MGAMTNVAIGPVPAGVVTMGQGAGNLKTVAGLNPLLVPFSAKMSNSYATGGDTIAMPSSEVAGREVVAIWLSPDKYGNNLYVWNGSQSAPKIQAFSALTTEVAATTDLSAVTVQGLMLLAG